MSSYFDYFCKNVDEERTHVKNDDRIIGTCNSMCPEDEAKLRETEKLVHVLEVLGFQRKLVKSYSRSAADSNMAVPQHLRPYPVLVQTVQYLLLDVGRRGDVPPFILYDFLNDRLRAVRQDMTIQRLPPEECVTLLEPMIRFYVHFGYKLSNHPLKDFEPVLNNKYLLECLKWYLQCSDTITHANGKVEELSGIMCKLDINAKRNDNVKLVNDRVLIECLYILCNLDNMHPLFRYIKLTKDLKSEPRLQLAYKIAVANIQGNYIKVCRLLDNLCPLTYCALYCYLPTLQRRALLVMSAAYSSKRLWVPSAALAACLQFPGARAAEAAATHYGLHVSHEGVRFDKADYKADVAQHLLNPEYLVKKFNLNIMDIYTYTNN